MAKTPENDNSTTKLRKAATGSKTRLLLVLGLVSWLSAMLFMTAPLRQTLPGAAHNKAAGGLVPTARRPRIAIVTGFVADNQKKGVRLKDSLLPHLLNKACYADLWGYDLIFNTTWAYPDATESQYWLKWGTWHRVPHMMAALPHYDWIVYADSDWIVQDLVFPLESLIKDWELNGQDAHILIPTDMIGYHTFSAFAVMVRNSPFGRRMLENWYEFSQGMCPKGNFQTDPNTYTWEDSDQPGIWYSLAKTHYEMYQPSNMEYVLRCTDDGYINTAKVMAPELNAYFEGVGSPYGAHGEELRANKVPPEQPILWSITHNETKSGLGVQKTWGEYTTREHQHAFAIHWKDEFNGKMKEELEMCQRKLGCYAYYDDNTQLQLGCNHTKAMV
jgi:galactosyl transferase GMA12/MNN10 family